MTFLGDEKCRNEWCRKKGGLGLQSTFSEPAPWKDEPAHNAIFQIASAGCEGSRARDQHALGPDQEPRSPHSGRYQQAEKSRIGAGAKSLGRGELLSSAKELFNLFVAIDVRRLASVTMREKPDGRNLGARFGGAMPDGEPSYYA